VLTLRWRDILHKSEITIVEQKTGKARRIPFNESVRHCINNLYTLMDKPNIDQLLFATERDPEKAMSIQYINQELKRFRVKYKLNIKSFSSHTFRKTFGRYVYEQNRRSSESLVLLNEIFRHSSIQITKTYIGITLDEINSVYSSIRF
jgi:integrase